MTLRKAGWFGGSRKREKPEVVQIDEFLSDTALLVAVWPQRVCLHCGSERIRCYGRARDKVRRYYRCLACHGKFLAEIR